MARQIIFNAAGRGTAPLGHASRPRPDFDRKVSMIMCGDLRSVLRSGQAPKGVLR
jgi:hypothetical protein